MTTLEDLYGPVISSYSRAQAIEDGVLVDLMQPDTVGAVREAGFTIPVAITSAAFNKAVWPVDHPVAADWLKQYNDLQGRLWDVLWMLSFAIKCQRGKSADTIIYKLSIVDWESKRRRLLNLKSVCGPGDDSDPCITIMLPEED